MEAIPIREPLRTGRTQYVCLSLALSVSLALSHSLSLFLHLSHSLLLSISLSLSQPLSQPLSLDCTECVALYDAQLCTTRGSQSAVRAAGCCVYLHSGALADCEASMLRRMHESLECQLTCHQSSLIGRTPFLMHVSLFLMLQCYTCHRLKKKNTTASCPEVDRNSSRALSTHKFEELTASCECWKRLIPPQPAVSLVRLALLHTQLRTLDLIVIVRGTHRERHTLLCTPTVWISEFCDEQLAPS